MDRIEIEKELNVELEYAKWIGAHNSISNVAISSFQLVNISHVKKERKRNAKKSD